ncbi:response regulator [Sphaerimonospora thailandensis]|uniref:Response regulatory domain-containing protein n=1 Tax=Sphaerimonospora thailandensis TaxID=795644 RepID=A0A8J3RDT8_9ACTN|nr:response regulator transcription factor [Sphaerimonospora thailandensis]GIH72974.1 hypothetical protein Mth01_52270 [Sphaerimonospora thailandensis]
MPEQAEAEITVFLVDDHAIVRVGLAAYLETEPGIRVVGQASNGRRALDELAVMENRDGLPDVVLMDVLMPDMDGITATAEIKRRWPDVEVVAVTSFLEESKIRAALEAGAAGYLLKDADAEDVADAIRAAHRGEVHLDPAAAKALTASLRSLRRGRLEIVSSPGVGTTVRVRVPAVRHSAGGRAAGVPRG